MVQYNTQQLIANIKRRGSIPTSQILYTDADFVALANDEMKDTVVSLVMSAREEYFVKYEDFSVNAQGTIEIPPASIGMKLRAVCWIQQNNPVVLYNMPRLTLENISGQIYTNSSVSGFYVQDNELIFWPQNSLPFGSQVRVFYYKTRLDLTPPELYARVLSVDTNTNSVVLDSVPTTFEVGSLLNTVAEEVPFDTTNESTEIISLSSPTVELSSVEGILEGDYISAKGTSAIPQLPIEAHSWLAQLTVVKCLEGLGDREGMKAAQAKADQVRDQMLILINPRVDGSVKKVIPQSGGMRTASGTRWRWW